MSRWICCFVMVMVVVSWGELVTPERVAALEEQGLEFERVAQRRVSRKVSLGRLDEVLLIPESMADVVGMYDPHDGTYLGDYLTSRRATVQVSGTGVAVVRVSEFLDAQVSGAGQIEFFGRPVVRDAVSGTGAIIWRGP